MIKVSVKKLTSNNFKKFGHVISAKNNKNALLINNGWTKRLNKLSSYQSLEKNASMPIISIFRGYRRDFPIEVKMLECHPLASQAFIPLFGGDWLIVACPGNEKKPDISKIECFIASQSQGINFFPGTWHHPLIIIDKVQDFLILDRDDENDKINKNLTVYKVKNKIVLNY
tara:strand:- start:44 stop:556 length:513 start_codon:yes stop_codon:yes gene_type:complete